MELQDDDQPEYEMKPQDEAKILALIEASAKHFGRINLSSGNCGQFAIALAYKLKDIGIEARLGFLHKYDTDAPDLEGLASIEPDIYHVVIHIGDNMYDATGKVTVDDLVMFSRREYYDDSPGYLQCIFNCDRYDDLAVHTIVEFETNWEIENADFYEFLHDVNIEEKISKKPKKRMKP